jgi:hypothetical protein
LAEEAIRKDVINRKEADLIVFAEQACPGAIHVDDFSPDSLAYG